MSKFEGIKIFANSMCACVLDCVSVCGLNEICDYFTTLFFLFFSLNSCMHMHLCVCVCVCVCVCFPSNSNSLSKTEI
jgi:hypothetical protein